MPNTLGIDCQAERLVSVASESQLADELREAQAGPVHILGEGSNVVLPDRLVGVTLRVALRGMEVVERSQERVRVRARAGENWHGLVRFCIAQRAYGLENLSLIPGTVGAAPVQNIGAYGVELADFVEQVRVFDRQRGAFATLDPTACEFGYRNSLFKRAPGRYVIVELTLRLFARPQPVLSYAGVEEELRRYGIERPHPAQVSTAICRIRRRKLPSPRRFPNAGSFFKNPVLTSAQLRRARLDGVPQWPEDGAAAEDEGARIKVSAAALIDRAGFKDVRDNGVGVWPRQPLVLVNYGAAGSTEVRGFAARIRAEVERRFGVSLEQEPILL